jgi:single-strand DNA-binding protein
MMPGAALPVATDYARRRCRRGGLPALGLDGGHGMRGAQTGLACGAASGNPAPGRGPAGCLPVGLPPRRLRGQGSLRAHECSLGLRPPLDRSGVDAARRHRSPGAGEEQRPTSRQETRTVADQPWDPHPRRHLLTHHPGRKEDQAPDQTTTATNRASTTHRAPRRGQHMPDTHVTIVGNLTDDPEVSFTPNGAAVCNFRLAVTARIKDGEGWRDGDTSFYRITAWRQLATHIGDSLAKGNRVIVLGQLRARSWETPEGERRSVVEVQAEEVGPSLRWATAKPERATNGKPSGQFNEDPPF